MLATLGVGVVVITLASSATWLYLYVVVYGMAFGARSPLRASVMAWHYGRRAYGTITAMQGAIMGCRLPSVRSRPVGFTIASAATISPSGSQLARS